MTGLAVPGMNVRSQAPGAGSQSPLACRAAPRRPGANLEGRFALLLRATTLDRHTDPLRRRAIRFDLFPRSVELDTRGAA